MLETEESSHQSCRRVRVDIVLALFLSLDIY